MDEFKNQNGKREFLEGAPEDNKVKIDFESIGSTESGLVQNERFDVAEEYVGAPAAAVDNQPVMPNEQFIPQPPVQQNAPVPPVQYPAQPPVQYPVQPPVQQPVQKKVKAPKVKKPKKAKNKNGFVAFIRIFVIVILSIATLWTVMYTVDHTLAAQGIGPVFSYNNSEYTVSYINSEEAGAWSYDCLGYKVQFLFDESGQLKQDCVWAWEEGPNDALLKRGVLFEIGAAE